MALLSCWRACPSVTTCLGLGLCSKPACVACTQASLRRQGVFFCSPPPQTRLFFAFLPVSHPQTHTQVIYIAPLKALVRERMNDWGKGLCKALGKKLVELTGVTCIRGSCVPDICFVLLAWKCCKMCFETCLPKMGSLYALLFASLLSLPAGDHTPDLAALLAADVIIATPEKWDGISRNWQTRGYVKKVCVGWPGVCRDVP